MVAHETKRDDLNAMAPAHPCDEIQEHPAINVVEEDVPLVGPPTGHMV